MSEHRTPEPGAPWIELVVTDADWDAADPELLARHVRTAGADPGVRGVRARRSPPAGWCTARPTPASARRAARSARCSRCTAEDTVNGSHRGHHQFLAKALAHVAPKGFDLAEEVPADVRDGRCCARWPRSAGSPAATATGAAARCTCSGRRPARWAPTPSSAAASRRRPATPGRTGRPAPTRSSVTYFGDGAANIGSMLETLQPGRGLEAAGLLLHREQPVRGVDHRRRGDRRAAAVRARPRLRHRQLAGRRDGPAGRAPRHARGGRAHARRRRARPSSRPTSTGSSTRTARSPAAPSATAARRRRRAGGTRDPLAQIGRPAGPARAARPGSEVEQPVAAGQAA